MKRAPFLLAALTVTFAGCAVQTNAGRTLTVGPGGVFARPSQAAAMARSGDTIIIAAGHYTDCAVWRADHLTIAGHGDVVIDGPVCKGKGLFVVDGAGTMVRGIAFHGARTGDGNGAGIRGEAENLTVEDSVFRDNENGILATTAQSGTVIIRNSTFEGNGSCAQQCGHGVYVGRVALLRIENSVFRRQHAGHHIKSRARRTELTGNTIADEAQGNASYLVDIPDGGALVMTNNTLQKGLRAENTSCAISMGEESSRNPTPEIVLKDNSFASALPHPVLFLRNLTGTAPVLAGNVFSGNVVPLNAAGA